MNLLKQNLQNYCFLSVGKLLDRLLHWLNKKIQRDKNIAHHYMRLAGQCYIYIKITVKCTTSELHITQTLSFF